MRSVHREDVSTPIIHVTTTAGMLELRRNARELVERAAKGERILITRHGKPLAELGPPGAPQGVVNPQQALWEKERAAFHRLGPSLGRKLRGRWVALLHGRVIASGKDHERLYQQVRRKHSQPFFIGRVGAMPPIIDMPGFEILP